MDPEKSSGARPVSLEEAPGRLVAQRTLFAGTSPVANEELYAVVEKGGSTRDRFALSLHAGAKAHTNTFFGRFPASYWQRWTAVTEVTVSVRVLATTSCRVLLVASDIGGHRRIVAATTAEGEGTITLGSTLDQFLDGGALWLEFEALDAEVTFDRIEWSVEATAAPRPLAIAICTFNRADDCANTVAALASDTRVVERLSAVYVVDQGTDPVEERALFRSVVPAFGDRLHYVRQPNLGGAGGFTRGLFEASASGDDTDVILMDDDILCEPEAVLRLGAFANCTSAPALVGAEMLFLYSPNYLLANAERVDLTNLRRGLATDKFSAHSHNVLKSVPERRVDTQYNGWWSCLIPAEAVRRVALPLPVFFQWDDVEYGLRCGRAGIPTVTLPGAAVWHADFYWKDVDGFAHYFSTRNGLVTAALDPGFAPSALVKNLSRDITRSIVSLQYGLAHTQLRAIEGFLDGPAGLADGGQEALATVNSERKRFPETVTQRASALPVVPIRRADPPPKPAFEDAVLAKRVVTQARERLEPGPVSVSFEDAQWWHVGRFAHVFVTDASQSGVRERKFDRDLAAEMTGRLLGVMKRFRAEAPAVAEAFRREFPQLTSRENWARLYEK
ncbi:glycosyltransferase [Rhodococcus sp. SGAir0479]|uniref:glycosyltransferase n=1 Tax=Rhodococcus sp. SGAir0479 TaxID=2567884 RepID=UPI0010CCC132|nr:glycosyltransferase [Rhodococcus sp. SGAir0479]QCQ93234.1 glycosyltransferase family 2 protein [Rhodococcus sp. SGAir0479]